MMVDELKTYYYTTISTVIILWLMNYKWLMVGIEVVDG